MKKRTVAILLLAALMTALLAGCGSSASYKDGTYTAQSSVYVAEEGGGADGNGYGEVTITIKDNVITDCTFVMYMEDGTVKDETYGMKNGEIANEGFYKRAQAAVEAGASYAEMLAQSGSLKGVDAISGATISYDQFTEAVNEALKQARD